MVGADMGTQGFESVRRLMCCQRYHGATGSMSHASTTDARAAPPTANSHRGAVRAGRVDALGKALPAVGEHLDQLTDR